ncbi:CocE/NonD family hydrolase [Pokkaliibacter sp. MBI-7]|uniref:CocE/NonD family hydrolase n=1 Tax=Pokkaliibacter sp. MBI-7 TaxID=3040600 RepID=UPI00244C6333|nr:CocE/NonD family hydrolase [Pokkaliibacter sp. MBI-7]MDH2433640.1 CocE/NonD family hydrolase [Pokkaliibacter sp. MBI-7]
MQIKTDFPFAVREIENLWIPLADGTRLAARVWLPEACLSDAGAPLQVPAILEYLPYRKRDGTTVRDELTHPYTAGHGYACVRVDMRGNGESEGLMHDEYLPQEQADCLEVIDWLTQQPWCSGKVGMMGISWGGFNSLQVAALKPKALKAIITLCSTDDRYADDIHYKGGSLLMENQSWAATMLSFSSAIADPALVGEAWLPIWKQRLENMPLLAETWLQHQTRDAYWQHASICEDYSAIEAATYCIAGWADSYINTIPRMMEKLSCPKKALIGPWMHKYPHFAKPEPAIGFLQEALRWWDYWLKDIDTGIMDEPECTFYLQDGLPPKPFHPVRPGVWVQTSGWPDEAKVSRQRWYLTRSGLQPQAEALAEVRSVCSPLHTGLHHGEYIPLWFGPDFSTDQRRDDANSLCFDSAPVSETLQILGDARLKLKVSVDQPCGQICVRLNDVAPDGKVSMITYGVLNLALRNDPAVLETPVPGETMDAEVVLDHIGYRLPVGHRLRVAIASASFPLLWPSPQLTTLSLRAALQELDLPVYIGEPIDNPFAAPEAATPCDLTMLEPAGNRRTLSEDVATGTVTVHIDDNFGLTRFNDHGLWVRQRAIKDYSVQPYDPGSTRAEFNWLYEAGRDDWSVQVQSWMQVSCDSEQFHIEATQVASHNGEVVSNKTWSTSVPRLAV